MYTTFINKYWQKRKPFFLEFEESAKHSHEDHASIDSRMENCRISARQDWRCSFSKFSLIGYVLVVLSWTAMQLRGSYWDRERSAVSTSEGMATINFEIRSFLLIFFLFFKSMELFHWWLDTWKIAPFLFLARENIGWADSMHCHVCSLHADLLYWSSCNH